MLCFKKLFKILLLGGLCFPSLALKPLSPSSVQLETTPAMKTETRYVVYSLEQLHYLGQSLQKLDMRDFLKSYMEDLDANKLFFLQHDLEEFCLRFESVLPIYLRQQGNLFPAFEIFKIYKQRVLARISWILDRTRQDLCLDTLETFAADRKKASWALNEEDLSTLWEKRLKYELVNELLWNKAAEEDAFYEKNDLLIPEPQNTCSAGYFFTQGLLPIEKARPSFNWAELNLSELYRTALALKNRKPQPDRLYSLGAVGFNFSKTWESWAIQDEQAIHKAKKAIRKRYKRLQENIDSLDAEDIQEIFLTTLTHMYDPHSTFLSSESMEELAISIKNALVGIGVVLYQEDGYCTIKELLPGGPAESTKQICPGDKIIAVSNDKGEMLDVIGMRQKNIVKYLRGKKGTPVHVLVQSALDDTKVKRVTIIRDEIKLASRLAKGSLHEVSCNGKLYTIGVIDLPGFYGGEIEGEAENNSAKDVEELISKLKKLGIEGIVLDLRYNSGGLFSEAINVAGLFLPSGPILQAKDSNGQISEYRDYSNHISWNGPLIVLISKYTASSSEIVIGALKNYRRAILVGDPSSHGKGTVQGVFEMDRSLFNKLNRLKLGAVKVTMQKWYLPNGESTQAKGVPADITLPSLQTCLPIGEADAPRFLEWDSIPPLQLDVDKAENFYTFRLSPEVIQHLQALSQSRQKDLVEFQYLQETVNWFKEKQEQKYASLNLSKRKDQQKQENTLRLRLKSAIQGLKQEAYPSQEVLLAVALDQKEKQEPAPASAIESEEADIHLRESLRIMADWLELLNQEAPIIPSSVS